MLGQVTGLPLEYLLGEASTRSEQHFYNLQAEETLSSLENSEISPPQASSTQNNLQEKKDNLTLNIEPTIKTNELIFSPGGTEAYVFSTHELRKSKPRGERPTTVGHADDSPKPKSRIDRSTLQGRLESLRSSLDFELEEHSSAQASVEHSPRRYLPRVPTTGYPDQEDVESMPSPSVTRRGALSPSIASVASGSTTASGTTDPLRRRNLEWDSGADLGYAEEILRQKEAAATLSTLEKLTIGNYSNFLRTEPEGTSTAKIASAAGRGGQQLLNRLPGGQDHEEDLRQMRLHKFADSLNLMKNRQFAQHHQQISKPTSSTNQPPLEISPSSAKLPKEANAKKYKSDTSQDGSPTRRRLKKNSPRQQHAKSRGGRSSSLTDLSHDFHAGKLEMFSGGTHSATDLSPRSFANTDPSSSSSIATVVPQEFDNEIDPRILEALNTDPSSLPVEFYGALAKAPYGAASGSKQSQTSLNSRQSVETVITIEQLLARQQHHQHKKNVTASRSVKRPAESDSLDTDDEIQMIRDQVASNYFGEGRNDAEGSEEVQQQKKPIALNNWLRDGSRAQSLPPLSKETKKKSSSAVTRQQHHQQRKHQRPPVADTTSEDERQKDKRSGTLDSAPIDRAKSFEYFPGESFPLQENSSSYEYLPGHMIHDTRPPTVVSNRPEGMGSSSSNLSPTTSPSAQSTSSNAVVRSANKKKRGAKGHVMSLDPSKLAYNLMEKSNHLHSAHVHQTMAFYTRLKEYINYISEPSQSPADARVKQQMADKILELMGQEEIKLAERRPLSFQLGLSPDFLDLDEDTAAEEPSTRKMASTNACAAAAATGVDEMDADHDATNVTSNLSLTGSLRSNSSKMDLTIQRIRISQMKKVRKEIKKLEKLDKLRLLKAEQTRSSNKSLTDTDLVRQIMLMSDDSSLTTTTSSIAPSECGTVTKVSKPPRSNYRGIEGQSASGSDNKNSTTKVRKPSVASVKEFCPIVATNADTTPSGTTSAPTNTKLACKKDGKTNTYSSSLSTQKSSNKKSREVAPSTDFGQTFPTPRMMGSLNSAAAPGEKYPKQDQQKKANRSNNKVANEAKAKPLSYFLPMPKASAIKDGICRIRSGCKENTNIMANYLSAINSGGGATITLGHQRPKTAPAKQSMAEEKKEVHEMSLREALELKKPGFIQRSLLRTQVLKQQKQARMLFSQKYKQWLEEVSKLPAKSRLLVPPPQMPKMPKLFSHREMIAETRAKYQKLPEIVYGKAEAKRKTSYKTNRLKADMYKKKLQRKVLQGRVSLSHHNQILE